MRKTPALFPALLFLLSAGCLTSQDSSETSHTVEVGAEGIALVKDGKRIELAAGQVRAVKPDRNLDLRAGGILAQKSGKVLSVDADGVATEAPEASGTISCGSTDTVERSNCRIDGASGEAVSASGKCRVKLTNCTLTSTGTAVAAGGQAEVELIDCSVVGGAYSIASSGQADVVLRNTTLQGRTSKEGQAEISIK